MTTKIATKIDTADFPATEKEFAALFVENDFLEITKDGVVTYVLVPKAYYDELIRKSAELDNYVRRIK